ncbi:MAG TPA: hypothetical protein V6D05_01875 [Stenomitos sp.]
MEIRNNLTGPLTSQTPEAALPPQLSALAAQLPPQTRQEVASLYQQAASGDPSLTQTLNPETSAGVDALKRYFNDLAEHAPTKELAELFKAASKAVISPEERRKMNEAAREVSEAIQRLIMDRQRLADDQLRAVLQSIRLADIEAAKDLLKRASRDQDARQASRLTAEQLVAAGLVTAIALPVVSQSKLEGVTSSALSRRQTLNDAVVDERMSRDALDTVRGHSSGFRLEDFSDSRSSTTNHLQRMRDFANE